MSDNKETEHIPTTNNKEEGEEEQKGSGGLLAPIGDPLGMSILVSSHPIPSHPIPFL
jgi:hypothetical protein